METDFCGRAFHAEQSRGWFFVMASAAPFLLVPRAPRPSRASHRRDSAQTRSEPGGSLTMRRMTARVALLEFALAVGIAGPAVGQIAPAGSPEVVEGTVVMIVEDDFLHDRAAKHYFLDVSGPGGRHDLKLTPKQARVLQPGMKVRVTGRLNGRVLTADPADAGVVVLEAAAAATPPAARKVLVLLVDITDSGNVTHSIDATCDGTSDAAAAMTFGFGTTAANVDGCYQDSSYGQLGIGGATYPGRDVDVQRVAITDDVTACNYTSWGSKADAAAANLGNYQHRVYVVPADVNCGWAGLAYISSCPGSNCQAWVKAYSDQVCGYVDAVAHEVGHNLGLMHASTDTNNDGKIDCEYCDDSDFMGYAEANLRPLNGPHRVQMGWVSGSGIVNASGGGQFSLSPLNLAAAPLPQVARITLPNGDPYYVSYRTAIGYDALLTSTYYSPGVVGEISIHRWPGGVNNTLFLTSLGDGQSFTDPANNLQVTQNSHNDSSVTFTVFVGLQPPTNLTATPGDSRVTVSWTANAGATTYNVKRATASGGPYATVGPNVSGTTYLDTPLVNGQTYYYVVSSVNGGTESPNSTQVSGTPNGIDLVVTAMGNPPATAAPGGTFSASDTVRNQGAVAAGASTTRFYLSIDQQRDGSDVLLSGSRSVPALSVGQSSSGNVTVTIPSGTPLGTYYLVGCADDLGVVNETNESNNCRTSTTTIQVGLADLVVTSLSNPPATAAAGGTFSVTATVANQGAITAAASTARYYLSADQVKGAGDVLLPGTRSVASLTAGQSSSGSTTVTIPSSIAAGTYYLLGCADDTGSVSESNEGNNCRASTTTLQIVLPDLVVTAVSNPPATVARARNFKITDTTKNQGSVTAAASTTRYYLSTDQVRGGADVLLSGTRSVSSLKAGQSSSGSNKSVSVPSTTPPGTYYRLACADDTGAVSETDEANNCLASTNTVIVQ